MAQYAIRGYAVDALDYVLKPVSYFAFSQRLSRAIGRMKKRERKLISVNIKGGTIRLDVANIYYIESQGHNLIFHTASGAHEARGTMQEAEQKLCGMNFFRGNKGYLINLAHVDGVCDGPRHCQGRVAAFEPCPQKRVYGSDDKILGRGGEVMEYVLPDIPRIYTAVAEWAACIVFVMLLEKRRDIWKTAGIAVGALVIQALFSWRRAAFRWYSGYRA